MLNNMQNLKNIILVLLGFLFLLCLASTVLSTVVGFVYLLYLWGSVGLAFGAAVWGAFILWVQMFLGGIILAGMSLDVVRIIDEAIPEKQAKGDECTE